MFCSNCGKELSSKTKYCTGCGTAQVKSSPVRLSGKKKFLIIGGVCFLLVILAAAILIPRLGNNSIVGSWVARLYSDDNDVVMLTFHDDGTGTISFSHIDLDNDRYGIDWDDISWPTSSDRDEFIYSVDGNVIIISYEWGYTGYTGILNKNILSLYIPGYDHDALKLERYK